MSTRTKYLLQGLFFLVLAVFCIYTHATGKTPWVQKFTTAGTILSLLIGVIYIKNAFMK
ncbi:MAG: hypothetical protein IKX81_03870 [Firmicutes bacterium]|nr:hypothetical protein [Bacillota bacterium]